MRVLRPLEESDVDAVLAVYREAWGDARPIHAHELRSWLRNPEVDPESLRVLEIDGRVVGYGDTTIADGVVAVEVAAPDHWETFLIWAEATAREAGASRVRVLSYAGDALAAVAAERGYYLWRSNYTMRIELESDPPYVSPLPAGIEIVRYADHHERRARPVNLGGKRVDRDGDLDAGGPGDPDELVEQLLVAGDDQRTPAVPRLHLASPRSPVPHPIARHRGPRSPGSAPRVRPRWESPHLSPERMTSG